MDTPAFNLLSLCAGVGGLDLGVRLAVPTARTVCFVEKEAYCCEVLARRMGDGSLDDAPIWTDLGTFRGEPWRGVVDCVVAGFPCQPFSQAARGRRTHPDLSGEVMRVIAECRPNVVFIENVYQARGRLAGIRESLSVMGYDSPPLMECRTSDVGGPHQRKRLFLLAHAHGYRQPELPLDDETSGLPHVHESLWEDYAEAVRVDDGVAYWMDRVRACGNGVVPLAAAYAWRTLRHTIEHGGE